MTIIAWIVLILCSLSLLSMFIRLFCDDWYDTLYAVVLTILVVVLLTGLFVSLNYLINKR